MFIDNEIQAKIKQNNKNLKFYYNDETQFKISFEETFTQKQTNKSDFPSSEILKTKENDNLDKSISTVDVSSNKITEKSRKKERVNIHYKTFPKVDNLPDKLFSNIICFNEKAYSIKNVSRQSSTFLILPKQKNAAEYLKTLCDNLKICKSDKKYIKHIKSISLNTKLKDLNQDKKATKILNIIKIKKCKNNIQYINSLFNKSQKRKFDVIPIDKKPVKHKSTSNYTKLFDSRNNEKETKKNNKIKKQKFKKDDICTVSLFRKSKKGNSVINSKHPISMKPTSSIFIITKQKQ